MKNKLSSIILIFCISGCASNIVNKVNLLEDKLNTEEVILNNATLTLNQKREEIKKHEEEINQIENDKVKVYKSITLNKKSLNDSRLYFQSPEGIKIFSDGSCNLPAKGPKPKPFCASEVEAKEFGLAYCSSSAGCDATLFAVSDKLDTFSKRFLASEACSRLVAESFNSGYSSDNTIVNAFEAASDTACSNESDGFLSMIVKAGGCLMSVSTKIAKVAKYMDCKDRESNKCYQSYINWESSPQKRKNACDGNLKNISLKEKRLDSEEKYLVNLDESIANHKSNILEAEEEIQKQEKKITYSTHQVEKYKSLIREAKDSVSWRVYGE